MGIINATLILMKGILKKGPKKYGAGRKNDSEGADILDIGGQSTRPGSQRISEKEEWERVKPVIQKIRQHNQDIILSIDTFYSSVAENVKLAVFQ